MNRIVALYLLTACVSVTAAKSPLPTLQQSSDRKAMEAQIAQAQKAVTAFNNGFVAIGKVELDGRGDPRDIMAQMVILQDGYFAGEVKTQKRPIGFRMHQYLPLDVDLHDFSGDIIDLGTVHMKQVPPGKLANLKGKIELADQKKTTGVSVTLNVKTPRANTPHNGTSPRRHWPAPMNIDVESSGTFSAEGFSPMEYYCTISAEGFVKQAFPVNFELGETLDIGTIRLERPIRFLLTYVVADQPPFDLSKQEQTVVSGGDRWKCTPDIYGWDLAFNQQGDQVLFKNFYGPCTLLDLGEGSLEDLVGEADTSTPKKNPNTQKVTPGHIYVVNQGHWKRWILFSVEEKDD